MVFGIIAEGKGDVAVIENILWSITGDDDEVVALRSEDLADETDLQGEYKEMSPKEYSSWTLVKADCENREKFKLFLEESPVQEERIIIIHLDTAECELDGYNISRPTKTSGKEQSYCQNLRQEVIAQINTWLDDNYKDQLLYAICIEETEAWLLPLYEKKDSSIRPDPKRHLARVLEKKKNTDKKFKRKHESNAKKGTRALQEFLSKDYQKNNKLKAALSYNQSLADFVESVEHCSSS